MALELAQVHRTQSYPRTREAESKEYRFQAEGITVETPIATMVAVAITVMQAHRADRRLRIKGVEGKPFLL